MIQKPFAEMQTAFLMPGGDFPYHTDAVKIYAQICLQAPAE